MCCSIALRLYVNHVIRVKGEIDSDGRENIPDLASVRVPDHNTRLSVQHIKQAIICLGSPNELQTDSSVTFCLVRLGL
jgi:hypothetical protein